LHIKIGAAQLQMDFITIIRK